MSRMVGCVLLSIAVSLLVAVSMSAGQTSVGFIENRGQVDPRVKYCCPGSRASVFFTESSMVIDLEEQAADRHGRAPDAACRQMQADPCAAAGLRGCAIYLRFEGANPHPTIEGRGELATKYNYFLGDDPSAWHTEVPAYCEIAYRDLWPGVDLVCRWESGRLAYGIVAAPGADTEAVRFSYDGADAVTEKGMSSLLVESSVGSILQVPTVSGDRGGALLWLEPGDECSDVGTPGILDDPSVMLWGTFLGGSGTDEGRSVVLDSSGNIVVTGQTRSSDFPTSPGAYDVSQNGDTDVFVAKLSPCGDNLLWSTFLGGSNGDAGYSLVMDDAGEPVVAGYTYSSNFPTTVGAYDRSHGGSLDAFVAKFSSSGNALLWSTYLGGSDEDRGMSLVLDASGNPIVTGETASGDFPATAGAYDTSLSGFYDAFVSKLSSSGSTLLWSTFLGGSILNHGETIILSSSDTPVIIGSTASPDFPTTAGAYDTSQGGNYDVFVTEISASGTTLLWSTFLGGTAADYGCSLVEDSSGNLVLTGFTSSADFPTTPAAYDTANGSCADAFVAELSGSGSALIWCTCLGGAVDDYGCSLVLDPAGNPVVTGYTYSADFPTTPDAYDNSRGGIPDALVFELSDSGSTLLWSSFLGGSSGDYGNSVVLDASGNPLIVGHTNSADFPTTSGSYDQYYNGGYEAFLVALDLPEQSGVKLPSDDLQRTSLLQVFPNPSVSSAVVRFYLPSALDVSVKIYSVEGQALANLADGALEPGAHQITWEGKCDDGAAVSPGIYFVRMEAGSYGAVEKIVLLR